MPPLQRGGRSKGLVNRPPERLLPSGTRQQNQAGRSLRELHQSFAVRRKENGMAESRPAGQNKRQEGNGKVVKAGTGVLGRV